MDPNPPGLVSIAHLSIGGSPDTLYVSDTVRLQAVVQDSAGRLLGGRAVNWQSDNPDIATVTPFGLVTGAGEGTAVIRATSGEQSASVQIVVRRLVHAVNIVPDAVCLRKGFTTTLELRAFDALGQQLPRDLRPVTWRSADGQIAIVTPQPGDSALTLGVAPGTVLVTGTLMGVADTVFFVVDPAPLGQPLTCGG